MSPLAGNTTASTWCWLNERTDEQLVHSLMEGEQDALAVLFDRYHRLVYSVALNIVRDTGEAEEVVQTVFLDFYRALAHFDARRGNLRVWLLQYAYHRAVNRKRDLGARHFYKWVDLDRAAHEPALSWSPSHAAEAARLTEQLLGALSPGRRQILELTYFEGLTAEEIAIRVKRPVGVVRHELYRGLASLRELMARSRSATAESERREGKEPLTANAQAI